MIDRKVVGYHSIRSAKAADSRPKPHPLERQADYRFSPAHDELGTRLAQALAAVATISAENSDIHSRLEHVAERDIFWHAYSESFMRLSAIRRWRGLTQAALADSVLTSRVYIAGIECGLKKPGRKMQKRLAQVLDVPVELLFPEY